METLCNRDLDGNCIEKIIDQRFPNKTCHLTTDEVLHKCQSGHSPEISDHNFKKPLITDQEEKMALLFIGIIACILTSLFGVFSNVVNIVVYWKQGLKDSITLGFFALSISDLLLVFMPLCMGILYIARFVLPDSTYDFFSIHYVSSYWAKDFLYSNSCLIIMFLSLERCCCIILPFKVQLYFTRKKTAIYLSALYIFHLSGILMNPAIVQLRWQLDPGQNETVSLRVWFTNVGRQIELVYSFLIFCIVPVGTQAVVTVCAFIMVHGLRKSSQFRASAARTNASVNQIGNDNKSDLKQAGQISSRDARLLKTMIFLVSMLSACNIPQVAIIVAWQIVPDINIEGAYKNTASVLVTSLFVVSNINASANMIVYYNVSTRFREVARELFCRVTAKN